MFIEADRWDHLKSLDLRINQDEGTGPYPKKIRINNSSKIFEKLNN